MTVLFGEANGPGRPGEFIRGDTNADGAVNVSDAVFTLSWLFAGTAAPRCHDTADVDDDGAVQITDAIALLKHLFAGTTPPRSPYPAQGLDPTLDDLPCP